MPLIMNPLPGARPARFWLLGSLLPEMVEDGLKVSEMRVEKRVGEWRVR